MTCDDNDKTIQFAFLKLLTNFPELATNWWVSNHLGIHTTTKENSIQVKLGILFCIVNSKVTLPFSSQFGECPTIKIMTQIPQMQN